MMRGQISDLVLILMGLLGTVAVNNIDNLTNEWDDVCPEKCDCSVYPSWFLHKNLRTVDCQGAGLTEIPNLIPTATEVLLLNRNYITSLKGFPPLPRLQELDLSDNVVTSLGGFPIYAKFPVLVWLNLRNNSLASLRHGTFSGLKYLEKLELSENVIDVIENHAFGGLTHLHKIYLSGNRIRKINAWWFHAMGYLQELYLDDNNITDIQPGIFTLLKDLNKLSMAGNQLTDLNYKTFKGSKKIRVLDLSRNRFTNIPGRALTYLQRLQIFTFDGNLIQRIRERAFADLPVMEISVCYSPNLQIIEKFAFMNLPNLVLLQLHDNLRLFYIDSSSFSNVPRLKTLYLHNNNLMAIPQQITEEVRSASEIHLYHNPLQCDCNIYWIKEMLSSDHSRITFTGSNKLTCYNPFNTSKIHLTDITLEELTPVCTPTTIPLFNDSYQLEIGQDLDLECYAIGRPTPHIYWMLPNGRHINMTSDQEWVELVDGTRLHITGVEADDAGMYACKADNNISYDISSTFIKVHSSTIRVVPIKLAKTYVTFTWASTEATVMSSHYQVLCYDSFSHIVKYMHLHPSLKKYTFSDLEPGKSYRLCVMYEHDSILNEVSCVNFTTKDENYQMQGITYISKEKVIIAIVSLISVAILIPAVVVLIKRKRRKGYEKPRKDDIMLQIPMENFTYYHPPNTPLCSSRTLLLASTEA